MLTPFPLNMRHNFVYITLYRCGAYFQHILPDEHNSMNIRPLQLDALNDLR